MTEMTNVPATPKKRGGCMRWVLIAVAVVFGCGILAVIGSALQGPQQAQQTRPASSAGDSTTAVPADAQANVEPAQPAEPNATATPEPLPTPLPQIGDEVTLGELRWRVAKAENLGSELTSDNQFIEPKTTAGKFVAVYFDVENLGKDPTSFLGVDLMDGVEREFGAFDEGFMFVPNELQCVLAKMNPNLPISCMVIFEIPADATELKLKVTSQATFGGEEALISLGL